MAHRQGVKFPVYLDGAVACDKSHMNDGFDMDAFRVRLKRLMDAREVKSKRLAKDAGLGETAIRDIFTKGADVRANTLIRLASYFDISVDDLVTGAEMKLSGRIRAGGEVAFEPAEDYDAPMIPRPPDPSGQIMALQVVGSSMMPKYDDGDIVYVRKDHDGIAKDALGEYCAVRTTDGGTYLKILSKGSIPGRYTLRSLNAPDMEDQEVVWAAPVKWVRHRGAINQ